jgi:formylglycine-generating enzyme required for sulfatase activity
MGSNLQIDPDAQPDETNSEGKPHTVVLKEAFFVSKYETTQGQYQRIMQDNPSYFSRDSGDARYKSFDQRYPTEQVTCLEAQEMCRRYGVRLPTEEEWEYAARAGTKTKWWCGDSLFAVAGSGNTADQSHGQSGRPPDPGNGPASVLIDDHFENTAPVGSLPN